jgi:hypothetical protein
MAGRPLLLFAALLLALVPARNAAAGTADIRFKAIGASVAAPGGYPYIEVDFINYGPSPAADLKVTITIPTGATYDGAYDAPHDMQCDAPPVGAAGTLTCTAASLAVSPQIPGGGFSRSVTLVPRIDPATPPGTVLPFQVTISSSNALQPSQSVTLSVTVVPPADLSVSANAPSELTAGDLLVTNVTLTNNGPGDAIEPEVSVPSSQAPVVRMTGPDGWDCSAVTACTTGNFPPGQAKFVVASPVPASLSGSVTQKIFTGSSNDPSYSNNTVYVTAAVDPAPKTTLQTTLTVTPEHFYAGDEVTYTATTKNTGTATAFDVQLWMDVPGIRVSTTCGLVSAVSCTVPTLAAGATQTITTVSRVQAPPASSVIASAGTSATNAPPDTATLSTKLNPSPPPNRRRAAHH